MIQLIVQLIIQLVIQLMIQLMMQLDTFYSLPVCNLMLWHVQVCKPKDFAMQINLHMENCWGIVRAVIDLCLKLDEGKYLIVKEPNKPVMRLYSVPENAFEQVC